mgnify:CR=1 FL=1
MIDSKKHKPLKGYYTITEAAKILKKSRQLVYWHAVTARKIETIQIGSILTIPESELKKLAAILEEK